MIVVIIPPPPPHHQLQQHCHASHFVTSLLPLLVSVSSLVHLSLQPVRALYAATGTKPPTWNFKGKYLVGRTGQVHAVRDLENQIVALLAETAEAAAGGAAAPAERSDL